MSPTAIFILVWVAVAVGCLVGFLIGNRTGRNAGVQEGRDRQYVDDFIDQGKREATRHGRDGKFVALRGKPNGAAPKTEATP